MYQKIHIFVLFRACIDKISVWEMQIRSCHWRYRSLIECAKNKTSLGFFFCWLCSESLQVWPEKQDSLRKFEWFCMFFDCENEHLRGLCSVLTALTALNTSCFWKTSGQGEKWNGENRERWHREVSSSFIFMPQLQLFFGVVLQSTV